MTKVQTNSSGKVYVAGGKALLAKELGTKSITENGTYAASSDSLDGYSSVTVNVSEGILEQLMENIVAGNNPVDTTALATAESQIAAFLTI